MPADYNSTILLPKTDFSMKAGLAQKEALLCEKWEKTNLYDRIKDNRTGAPVYLLHDGPPYANGDVHLGTALNKVLKDIIIRYKTMCGFCSPYLPGWDTHGLPIELKALEKAKKSGVNSKDISKLELRALCRDFALQYVDIQRGQFKRLGVLGEFNNPYMTLTPDFEARQIKVFGEMVKKGYIYKGKKAVYWCPEDKTALAEAEIEYCDDPCTSIYVAFDVEEDNGALSAAGIDPQNTQFIIWTTTAWTIPGNVAICLGSEFEYAFVRCKDKTLVIANELVDSVMSAAGITEYTTIKTLLGSKLLGIECRHPFLSRISKVIMGEHVTLSSGSGCVHTAPGHGAEDFEICTKKYPEIPIVVPVDEGGIFTEEAGMFAGQNTTVGGVNIIRHMQSSGHLFAKKEIVHSYPHCWRCKTPILFRTTQQWFCSIDTFKEQVFKAIKDVEFIPSWGSERMTGMVKDRNDWCISRQRTWGVPIPVFYCDSCGAYHVTEDTINVVSELFRREGSDAWYRYEASEILPHGTKCTTCNGQAFSKETDIMDVWFDSGTTHTMLLEKEGYHWPADLYLEGGDQFRGWFQSSLLTAVAYRGAPPYKTVLTHGWVVDGEGRKMSKSIGNGILAEEIIEQYGADILRLWVASCDYQTDIRVSKDILKQLSQTYRKIRNTARFILGNLSDYSHKQNAVKKEELLPLDRYILHRLYLLINDCNKSFGQFEFHSATYAVHQFCVVELSNFYLDIIKDRLYCEPQNSHSRRAAQTTITLLLCDITRLLAPVLVFTADEIWQYLCVITGETSEIALCDFPTVDKDTMLSKEQIYRYERIADMRDIVTKALETAREEKLIGSSQEAAVTLTIDDALYNEFSSCTQELCEIFIVSDLTIQNGDTGKTEATISRAQGEKCQRCWCYTKDPVYDGDGILCSRCFKLIKDE